jgi:hypothetical protein
MNNLLNIFDKPKFSPSRIGSLQLWLDSSDFATITKDGSNLVSQWNDKSTGGFNAVQGTGAAQPTWSVAAINSKDAITFDGASSTMAISGFTSIVSRLVNFTIIAAFKSNDNTLNTKALFASTLSTSDRIFFGRNNNRNLVCAVYDGSVYTAKNVAFTDTTSSHVMVMTNASGTINQYVDGVISSGTSEVPLTSSMVGTRVGSSTTPSFYWNGQEMEILLYSRVIETDERQAVEKYLKEKWGSV